ncbi:hypothetical protein RB195_018634 [Necator americanus]|uniref:Uncharacterized protein n=1 Tax=Necator americanus TaxID=51031 RepID=A0ABR1CAM7_NECAM
MLFVQTIAQTIKFVGFTVEHAKTGCMPNASTTTCALTMEYSWKCRIGGRSIINIESYTTDADKKKVGDCAVAMRNDCELVEIPSQQAVIVEPHASAKLAIEQQSDVLGKWYYPAKQTSENGHRLVDLLYADEQSSASGR